VSDEESTKEMDDAKPILERILRRLDSMDERLQRLEQQDERRAMDTKPIWERALAEILEVKESVRIVDRKLSVMNDELLEVKADQRRLESRVDDIEKRPS